MPRGYGGTYTAANGARVRVLLAESYGANDALWRSWGEFLSRLPHGSELSSALLDVVPPGDVVAACGGPSEDGCYDPNDGMLVVPGSPPPDGQSPAAIAAHEYGHHVAAHRSNSPWDAYDWGTKRWSSYEDVCRRVRAGTAFPGDEARQYARNPGEAFADAYRDLAGGGWSGRFDASFRPDAASLAALREDVEHPWRGPAISIRTGRVAGHRRLSLGVTTLDGRASARLLSGSSPTVRLARVGARSGSGGARVSTTICGQDAFRLEVRGNGRYRLALRLP